MPLDVTSEIKKRERRLADLQHSAEIIKGKIKQNQPANSRVTPGEAEGKQ